MGDHLVNPKAQGFDMLSWKTEIPRLYVEGSIAAEIVPSREWLDSNPPDSDGKRPECPPLCAEVRWLLVGAALFPSRLQPPIKWPKGSAPAGELHRMSLVDFLRNVQALHPELTEAVVGVLTTEGDPRAE